MSPRSRVIDPAAALFCTLLPALAVTAGCGGGSGGGAPDAAGPAGADAGSAAGDTALSGASDVPPAPGGRITSIQAGGGKLLASLRFTVETGALALVDSAPAGDDARYADLDASGRHLYLQTQLGNPIAVLSFDIAPDGKLQRASELSFPYPMIEGVSQVLLHPSGRWFLISVSDRLAGLEDYLMPVGADGRLGATRLLAREFYGFNWDPSGKYFYGFDGEAIFQYRFDEAGGAVTASEPPLSEGSSGRVVLGLRAHPGGKWAYSIEESALGQFAFDPATGVISKPIYLSDPVPDEPALWTSIVLHGSGRVLYAAGYVADTEEALVDVFRIDASSGALGFVEREKGALIDTGLQAPLVLADWLVAGGKSMADDRAVLAAYRIDPSSGALAPAGGPVPLPEGANVNFILGVR